MSGPDHEYSRIVCIDDGKFWIVVVEGSHLDSLQESHDLRAAFFEAVDKGAKEIVVDLSNVDYINSSGLGQLAWFARQARGQSLRCAVVALRPSVRRLVESLQLDTLIDVHESLESYRLNREELPAS